MLKEAPGLKTFEVLLRNHVSDQRTATVVAHDWEIHEPGVLVFFKYYWHGEGEISKEHTVAFGTGAWDVVETKGN